MAFTKNPTISTYSTERQNFVINPLHRSGSLVNKDARLVNMIVEVFQNPDGKNTKLFVKTRPGLSNVYANPAGVARGIYYWVISGVGYAISVVGTKVYSNSTEVLTLTTSTGEVNFTEFVDSSGTVKLVMLDGTKGYVFTNSTTATEITSVDFPTPHVPMPVFLDGYLFVAKAGTQDVYNSNLDDPALWTAGDYISAEMYPDKIVGLSKNNNYIYAVGSNSVEFLYDQANASGSPLGRHESAVQQFGCAAPGTIVSTEKEVVFVGQTGNGGHTVWTIEGFKENEIGTPAIRSIFRHEGTNIVNAKAHCVRVSGQKLYIINLTSMALVYSFDTKMWSEWYSGATNLTNFVGTHSTDGPGGMAYVLHKSSGNVLALSEDNHTDLGTTILSQIVTPKYDFDTFNRKFMSRLSLIGDIPDGSGAGNVVQVYWTDDDYQTWVGPRDLSFDYDFPCIAQLGNFRRRAFKFEYNQPYILRLEAFEVDINKGNQ